MITKERFTEVVNSMTHGAGFLVLGRGHINHIFTKKSSLFPGIDQTEEDFTKKCKFPDPRGRGSCARIWPYKSYRENAIFLSNIFLLYSQA